MRLASSPTVSETDKRSAGRVVRQRERFERGQKETLKMIEEADKMPEDNVEHFAVLANVDARLKLLEKKYGLSTK